MSRCNVLVGLLAAICLCPALASADAIHDAARAGDLAQVRTLLTADPQLLNAPDAQGRTPLHMAAYFGRTDVIEFLLAQGADRNARDKRGSSPLDAAAARQQDAAISLLLQVDIRRLAEHVHRLTPVIHACTNLLVSTGPDGVLMVDSGEPATSARVLAEVTRLGGAPPKYLINTHLHGAHNGANATVGAHATIIDATNIERHAAAGVLKRAASLRSPAGHAFDTIYTLRFNGEDVYLIPVPGGHSNEDLIVYFPDSHVVATTDLVDSQSFPPCGPRLKRYFELLDTIIDVFPANTTFIAGHGHDCTLDEVKQYRATLLETIAIIKQHVEAGETVEQMRTAQVLKKWASWGDFIPQLGPDYWIGAVYGGLTNSDAAEPTE